MGDPKKIRKKYSTPSHPWQKARIDEEKLLRREYGLKSKKEIWVASSLLENFKAQIKKLNAQTTAQADKEKEQIRNRLLSYDLIKIDDELDTVLGLNVRDVLDRRLQTVLFKKHLARTITQARQFIVHRHIFVSGKKITVPSYLVKVSEEGSLGFAQSSSMANPNHPERYEQLPNKNKDDSQKKGQKKELDVVAFDDIKDEEEIVKDIKPKKEMVAPKAEEVKTEAPKAEVKAEETPKVEEKAEVKAETPKVEEKPVKIDAPKAEETPKVEEKPVEEKPKETKKPEGDAQ